MSEKNKKILTVVLLLCIYCFAFQGSRGLFEPDEGRYSAVALQMLRTHDWITPRTHPQVDHWTKPPLTYWAIATSILIFGKNEFAVRFTNACSFLLTIVICYHLGRILLKKQAWLGALIFGTFFFTATMCNGTNTDYLLMLWETLAVFFFAQGYWSKEEDTRELSVWFMWAAFGLGFLTKGPVALLPLASIIIFLHFRIDSGMAINMHYRRGSLLLLLLGGGWYLLAITIKPGLLGYLLWDEIFLRYFTSHAQRHPQWFSFLYIYIPVLIAGSLPWTFYALRGLVGCLKPTNFNPEEQVKDEGRSLFLGLWFAAPLVFFILSRSNLPLYVLPIFVPFAFAAALELQEREVGLAALTRWIAIWCLGIVLIRPVMAVIQFKKDARNYARKITKLVPGKFDEIIFVNTPPALGLTFYTGADVRMIDLSSEDWHEQLQANKSRLWFVVQNESLGFARTARMVELPVSEVGPFWGRKEYIIYKENTEDTRNPFNPPLML